MPEKSNGKGQTKCSSWFSRLGVGRGANDATLRIFTVKKQGRRPRHNQGRGASKDEEEALKCSFDFSIDLILPAALWPGVDSAYNRNEYQESSLGVKGG
jgi:hypothetical protein